MVCQFRKGCSLFFLNCLDFFIPAKIFNVEMINELGICMCSMQVLSAVLWVTEEPGKHIKSLRLATLLWTKGFFLTVLQCFNISLTFSLSLSSFPLLLSSFLLPWLTRVMPCFKFSFLVIHFFAPFGLTSSFLSFNLAFYLFLTFRFRSVFSQCFSFSSISSLIDSLQYLYCTSVVFFYSCVHIQTQ